MLLRSFSYRVDSLNENFYHELWSTIIGLKGYFYTFCKRNTDEAMQAVFIHALYHYKPERGDLKVYIKSLARTIIKKKNREVTVDFLEQTLSLEDNKNGKKNPKDQPEVDTTMLTAGKTRDFTEDLASQLDHDVEIKNDIVMLALEFMDKYIKLCNALLTYNTSTNYYPEIFIKMCIKLSAKYSDFNQECLKLYNTYKDYFEWFLNIDNDNKGPKWCETDYFLIGSNASKRVKFINSLTNEEVTDADRESWYVRGKFDGKRIIKVRYEDVWNLMCDLIESQEINECKFIINDNYILKSFGGSISVLNVDLFNYYELFKTEIATNLLKNTSGRLINIGSQNMYILTSKSDLSILNEVRIIRGYEIKFDWEDITARL